MIKRQYVFIYEHLTLGGTQTLLLRMAKWLKKNNICDVLVISKREDGKTIEKSLIENNIEVRYLSRLDKRSIYNCIDKKKYKMIDFIAFHFDMFLIIEEVCNRIKKRKDFDVNTILYVVHPNCLKVGMNINNPIIKKLTINFYKRLVTSFIKNQSIIFMDEETVTSTEKFYQISIKNSPELIFRLPINVTNFDSEIVKKRFHGVNFNLLTIARAEFPFKGYILGLIKDYSKLREKYKHLQLTVISYGPGVDEVKKLTNSLPKQIRDGVNLVGSLPYEELENHIKSSNLYIGMGTTVLDTANLGLPVITVIPYTFENKTSGFFHENPTVLGTSEVSLPACNLIEQVIKMDYNEYLRISGNSFRAIKDIYDINTVMNELKSYRNVKIAKRISKLELKINEVLFSLISIKKMIKVIKSKKES